MTTRPAGPGSMPRAMLATSLAGALRAAQPARIVTRIILARRRQSLHRGHDRVWTGQCEESKMTATNPLRSR